MKKIFLLYIFLTGCIAFSRAQNFCDIHQMSDTCKKSMKPFLYSTQSALHVPLKSESQVRDVNFPTFEGEKYRIIINTLSMPKGTEVGVYDQDATHKKRKQFFDSKTNGVSNLDTESKSGRIFIEYTIPPATATTSTGCAVVVIGYENHSSGDKEADKGQAKGKEKKK